MVAPVDSCYRFLINSFELVVKVGFEHITPYHVTRKGQESPKSQSHLGWPKLSNLYMSG